MVSAVRVELFQSGRRVASEWCYRCDGFEVPSYHGCTKWALASTKIGEIRSASSNIECNGDPIVPPYHKVFLAIGSTYSFVVVDNTMTTSLGALQTVLWCICLCTLQRMLMTEAPYTLPFFESFAGGKGARLLGLRRQKRKQWRRIWLHEPLLCW